MIEIAADIGMTSLSWSCAPTVQVNYDQGRNNQISFLQDITFLLLPRT